MARKVSEENRTSYQGLLLHGDTYGLKKRFWFASVGITAKNGNQTLYYKAMFEKTEQSVRLLSFSDDQPNENIGSLIPASARQRKKTARPTRALVGTVRVLVSATATAAFLFALVSGYSLVTVKEQFAAPTVTIVDPTTFNKVTLSYGPLDALSHDSFFTETRDAFIEESISFIEVDVDAKLLRFFDEGVLLQSAPIAAIGEQGSWFDAPSGLYKIDKKIATEFSNVAQVYLPWAIVFEGNYVIHGRPQYPDKSLVPADFSGGGIRIDDEAAKKLFDSVREDMPVLVHQKPAEGDAFVYEPTVPNIETAHYLIADIENGAILAASDLDVAVPIASLTKLMSAVVTSEKLNLDSRVQVTSPTFVESLIPRLQDRTSVSMYSLLQLLLVESSNEAAEVIAGEYGKDSFVSEMNSKATQLGMVSTRFVDPSGLGAGNVSSLVDLFRLTQYIHTNRQFIFDITADGEVSTIEGTNEFEGLVNFNQVDDVDNFVGGKVGETSAAGQTSVSLHTVKIQGSDRIVVVVLLGSAHRNADVKLLVDFVEERFKR
jgi:D-alanyl-D-alanine endopeptidase (penicillin-binding protein 7)